MRGIKKTQFGEENYIILYNVESNKSYTIMGLDNILQKNFNTYIIVAVIVLILTRKPLKVAFSYNFVILSISER